MEQIATDENLIDKLTGSNSLISSKITRINIYNSSEDEPMVDIYLELMYAKPKRNLLLRFIDIKQFSFFYHKDYIFYNVEILKFFTLNEEIYISFDPVDESEIISEEDQDYLLCNHVEGYWI